MKKFCPLSLILVVLISCNIKSHEENCIAPETIEVQIDSNLINKDGNKIRDRFLTPKQYIRTKLESHSFSSYLRELKLKPYNSNVKLYEGSVKYNYDVYEGVVDLPIGDKNLHQCADAIIRLKAEYHWSNSEFDRIHFNLTNGDRVDYNKWRQGYRMQIENNKSVWVKSTNPSSAYSAFWNYLELIFTYAGTYSLSKELIQIDISDAKIGDILIKGGFPGHAVLIVDEAIDMTSGRKLFLLGQSYMPAQEFHILKNNNDKARGAWYELNDSIINTPEWTFTSDQLMRFRQ